MDNAVIITLNRSHEHGMALITTVILLLVTTLFGVSIMQTVAIQEKIAGNYKEHNNAFWTGEAGARLSENWLADDTVKKPAVPDDGSITHSIVANDDLKSLISAGSYDQTWWQKVSNADSWWAGRSTHMPEYVSSSEHPMAEGADAYYVIASRKEDDDETLASSMARAHLGTPSVAEANLPLDLYYVYSYSKGGTHSSAREQLITQFAWRHRK